MDPSTALIGVKPIGARDQEPVHLRDDGTLQVPSFFIFRDDVR